METINISSYPDCKAFNGEIIKVGDSVWIPAGASDPAGAEVVAILKTSWPTLPESPVKKKETFSCLLAFKFKNNETMFHFADAGECERA